MEHPEWFFPDEYEPDCDKWGSCNRSKNPMQVCRHATTQKRHNCMGRRCPTGRETWKAIAWPGRGGAGV